MCDNTFHDDKKPEDTFVLPAFFCTKKETFAQNLFTVYKDLFKELCKFVNNSDFCLSGAAIKGRSCRQFVTASVEKSCNRSHRESTVFAPH